MRSVLIVFLSIAVVQTQFGLSTAATTRRPSTTRRMNWLRNKVTRVQEWAGLRRTTVARRTTTHSSSLAPHSKNSGFLASWRTTPRSFVDTTIVPTHGQSSGFLDKVKQKLGFVAVVPVVSQIPSPDSSNSGLLNKIKEKIGITTSSTSTTPRVDDENIVSTTFSTTTTRKSLIDRAREKLGFTTTTTVASLTETEPPTPGFFSRSFDKIKSLLGIGSTDPAKPNLVVKYGKKAVEKLGPKILEKIKKNFHGMSSFFSTDEEFPTQLQNFEGRTQTELRTLKEKVEKLEKLVEGLQSVLLKDWNVTESGSKYRLFEERKNWDNAETHCQGFGAHLAIIDNEAKNNFVTGLVNSSSTSDFVWIGMKTKTTTQSSTFTNFDSESPIDGCAVLDSKGVWSIRSCIQLRPFVCQIVKNTVNIK